MALWGRLAIPDTISNAELATRLLPRRYATEYFVYRKDKYWHGDDMVDHTVRTAIPIFNAVFPGCQAVFLFNNSSNRSPYAADVLRVENMNLHPSGKQACCGRASCMAKDYRSQCYFRWTTTAVSW